MVVAGGSVVVISAGVVVGGAATDVVVGATVDATWGSAAPTLQEAAAKATVAMSTTERRDIGLSV